MKKAIQDFLIGFLYTFTNDKRGNSARKTTAFALMLCVAYIHLKYVDTSIAVSVLTLDLIFVLLCLGLVSSANIVEMWIGKKSKEK